MCTIQNDLFCLQHSIPVVCETCLKMMTQEEEKRVGVDRGGGNSTVSRNPPLKETLCNCVACCNKRCAIITIIYMYLCYLHAHKHQLNVVITCITS